LVWPQASVTETLASRPFRPDFIGSGVIAWVPNDLIEGAFSRSVNAVSLMREFKSRFSRVGRLRDKIGFVFQ